MNFRPLRTWICTWILHIKVSREIEIRGVVMRIISGEGCRCTVSPSHWPVPSLLPVTQVREEEYLIFISNEKRYLSGTTQKACCLACSCSNGMAGIWLGGRVTVGATAAKERWPPRPATPTELLWSKNAQVFSWARGWPQAAPLQPAQEGHSEAGQGCPGRPWGVSVGGPGAESLLVSMPPRKSCWMFCRENAEEPTEMPVRPGATIGTPGRPRCVGRSGSGTG